MSVPSDRAVLTGAPAIDLYKKIAWRIMPFVILCYVTNYLDRVNVGFAKLQMMVDLHFSDVVYGFGAGIFFVGYFIFEVPSNLMLHRVGARRWIARIMISWALISAATFMVHTPTQFYIARFALGVAEAGFSPGIMLYLTYWFPARKRGTALGLYYIAIPLSGVIGGPLSGWILDAFRQSTVLANWQWLFILEALPALFAGFAVLFLMVDKPADAKWLSPAEKTAVVDEIRLEDRDKTDHHSARAFVADRRIWKLALVYFCQIIGLYGISFWLPSIIKASGVQSVSMVGWLSALPYVVAIPAIILSGMSADRSRARRMHFSVALTIGALGLCAAGYMHATPVSAVVWLSVATAGILSALSLFWGIPSAFLSGATAAAGIAAINCIGNLAGFVSPYMVGWLNVAFGRTDPGLYAIAAFLVLGALLVRVIPGHLADR